MQYKADAHETLDALFHQYGIPITLVSDDAPELVKGEFQRKAKQVGVYCKEVEPHFPWMNRAELGI